MLIMGCTGDGAPFLVSSMFTLSTLISNASVKGHHLRKSPPLIDYYIIIKQFASPY